MPTVEEHLCCNVECVTTDEGSYAAQDYQETRVRGVLSVAGHHEFAEAQGLLIMR